MNNKLKIIADKGIVLHEMEFGSTKPILPNVYHQVSWMDDDKCMMGRVEQVSTHFGKDQITCIVRVSNVHVMQGRYLELIS